MSTANLSKKVLFTLGRKIVNNEGFKIGKYKFTPVPGANEGEYQGVLEYSQSDENLLHGVTEANLILALSSMILRSDAKFVKSDIYGEFLSPAKFIQRTLPSYLTSDVKVVPDDITIYLNKAESMDGKVFDRFLRSCGIYQKALRFMKDDPILSFFLLVSAIETLANTVITGSEGSETKYKKFVYEYSSNELKKEQDTEFGELLDQAYRIRSKFTHFGTNYESPIGVADLYYMDRGLRYFRDHSEKPPVKVPSVYWFEKVVHTVLMEFLNQHQDKGAGGQKLTDHALKLSTVTTVASRAIEKGEQITLDDIRPD